MPRPLSCSSNCLRKITYLAWLAELRLFGSNKYACEACKCKQDAIKRLMMLEVPKLLSIQLKRFSYLGYGGSKIGRHVRFTMRLDLGNYCTQSTVSASPLYVARPAARCLFDIRIVYLSSLVSRGSTST